jgi:DNA-binding NtrC family response regulator
MSAPPQLLLVDDDRHLANSMAEWLGDQGYAVEVAYDLRGARERLRRHAYQLVMTDLRLDDGDGFELIGLTRKLQPECEVLVVTGYATAATAVEAVRAGAFDLLTKPLIDEELELAIERALQHREIEAENVHLRQQLDRQFGQEQILGHDYRMLKVFDVIDSVADARASVLITGENGTGKSMIARAIHRRSNRAEKPFVEVACGALPESLLESELFGHVAGAFTGATQNKVGKFKLADQGTLFLDEIGTASPALQVKLLRVLQELQFEAVGGTETETVDTRVILATNEDLATAVREGRFRQDLYYRVNVINLELPALRERAGDIPLLVDQFLQRAAEDAGKHVEGFDREALACMQQYPWPGNVRELENVVERAVLLARQPQLGIEDLPPQLRGGRGADWQPHLSGGASPGERTAGGSAAAESSPLSVAGTASSLGTQPRSLRDALEEPERQIILAALRRNDWNRAATAEELDINRTTLYKKMKRLGLDDPRLQYALS